MTTEWVHDYAGCQNPECELCDSYAVGYSQGKVKAYAEMRGVPTSGHAADCGCEPCSAVRSVVNAVLAAPKLTPKAQRVLDRLQASQPAHHLEDCAGPGAARRAAAGVTSSHDAATIPTSGQVRLVRPRVPECQAQGYQLLLLGAPPGRMETCQIGTRPDTAPI